MIELPITNPNSRFSSNTIKTCENSGTGPGVLVGTGEGAAVGSDVNVAVWVIPIVDEGIRIGIDAVGMSTV
jgi:hypothetical protein